MQKKSLKTKYSFFFELVIMEQKKKILAKMFVTISKGELGRYRSFCRLINCMPSEIVCIFNILLSCCLSGVLNWHIFMPDSSFDWNSRSFTESGRDYFSPENLFLEQVRHHIEKRCHFGIHKQHGPDQTAHMCAV